MLGSPQPRSCSTRGSLNSKRACHHGLRFPLDGGGLSLTAIAADAWVLAGSAVLIGATPLSCMPG